MKILKTKISNKEFYITLLIICIIFLMIIIIYPINTIDNDNKNDIGKAEVFVKGIVRPQGMVLGMDGKLFVQSALDGNISLITKDGKTMDYSYVGNYYGYGIELDTSNNFVIANKEQVIVIDNSGKVLKIINGFKRIYDVVRGPDNTIFASDSQRNIIYCISKEGKVSEFAKLGDKKSNSIPNAAGLCFDKDYKNLFVVNMYKGELYKISLSNNYQAKGMEITASNLQRPNFIDADEQGNVYITCVGDNTVVRVNQNSIKELIEIKSKLTNPSGIAVYNENNDKILYVASRESNSIYKINIAYKK